MSKKAVAAVKDEKSEEKETVYHVRCVLESTPGFRWTEGHVNNSAQAAELLGFIKDADREHMAILCLSNKNVPLAYAVVAMGAGNNTRVTPSELLRFPMLAGAGAFIIAHNHPSGDVTPSQNDRLLTEKIMEAARLLGFRFLDHIIVGPGGTHYSFADFGQMPASAEASAGRP